MLWSLPKDQISLLSESSSSAKMPCLTSNTTKATEMTQLAKRMTRTGHWNKIPQFNQININGNQIAATMPQRDKPRPVKLMESLQATPSSTARSGLVQGSTKNSGRNHSNRKQIWLMEMQWAAILAWIKPIHRLQEPTATNLRITIRSWKQISIITLSGPKGIAKPMI